MSQHNDPHLPETILAPMLSSFPSMSARCTTGSGVVAGSYGTTFGAHGLLRSGRLDLSGRTSDTVLTIKVGTKGKNRGEFTDNNYRRGSSLGSFGARRQYENEPCLKVDGGDGGGGWVGGAIGISWRMNAKAVGSCLCFLRCPRLQLLHREHHRRRHAHGQPGERHGRSVPKPP